MVSQKAKQDQILGQFFQSPLLNMTRNIILKIIKINYLEKFKSPKTAEMAENDRFVGPRGPNYDPFFKFLLITSKYAKKHHIKISDKFIHYNII